MSSSTSSHPSADRGARRPPIVEEPDLPVRTFTSSHGKPEYLAEVRKQKTTDEERLAFVIIAMWIARQPLGKASMIQAKVVAARRANALVAKQESAYGIAQALFADEPTNLLLQKARSLIRLWTAPGLHQDVRDGAYCHASGRSALTAESLRLMERYVNEVVRTKPAPADFNENEYERWRPVLIPDATM